MGPSGYITLDPSLVALVVKEDTWVSTVVSLWTGAPQPRELL